ncbi:hypothetical protein HAX54_018491 [Datura stramonium]|uniref:Uncharacterized protein n=1 Tax=Datura stramonium TaxID=4076 RepID=A0ABS8UPM7_DATST|nr:hypothetical protein [Datura stramonium]
MWTIWDPILEVLQTLIRRLSLNPHIQTRGYKFLACKQSISYWVETELIRMLSFIPGLETMLPNIIAGLHSMKDKYMAIKTPSTSNIKHHRKKSQLPALHHQKLPPSSTT